MMLRAVVFGAIVGLVMLVGFTLIRNHDRKVCEESGGFVALDENRRPICIKKEAAPSAPPR